MSEKREFCYTCRSAPCECYREEPERRKTWTPYQTDEVEALNGGPKPTVYAPTYFEWRAARRRPQSGGLTVWWYGG